SDPLGARDGAAAPRRPPLPRAAVPGARRAPVRPDAPVGARGRRPRARRALRRLEGGRRVPRQGGRLRRRDRRGRLLMPRGPAAPERARRGGERGPPPAHPRRLVGLGEAAAVLGASVYTVRRLVWTGALPAVRLTRRVQVDVRDLDRLIERCKSQL